MHRTQTFAGDQGTETAEHARFSVATGCQWYGVLAACRADNPAPRPD